MIFIKGDFVPNAFGRLISETNALGKTRTFTYDAAGNRTLLTDRNGKTRRFSFDPLNRLTTETWTGDGRTINSSYDATGQLTQINDAGAAYNYAYDPDGRLLSVNNAGTTGSPSVLMNYGYDAAGNMLSATDSINGTPASTNTYTFDPLNRVTRMQQSGAGVTNKRVDYAYNAVGQPINVKRFADLAGTQPVAETTHTFDPLNRLSTINHGRGGVPLASYNYGYDANSRITGVTNKDGTSTNTYDDTDQLTGVNYNGSQPDEAYSYDANGNRTNPGYVTGANNRLLSDGKFNYEYDGEGNVIKQTDILSGEITQYTWDYRNRLTNVTRNGVTVGDYAYDVYDQRIGKVTPTGTERFVFGQNQNIALAFDGSGTLTNRYLHGNSIDEVLADEANGSVGWALTDNLGSVRDVVDTTGTSQNHVVFDSFGNVTSQSNPGFKTRFSFTGREFDAETGNYDYRSRPLNPRSGRFIEEDAISFAGNSWNLYSYVGNLPTNFIDPEWDRTASGRPVAQPRPYLDTVRYRGRNPGGVETNPTYTIPNITNYKRYLAWPVRNGTPVIPLNPSAPEYNLPLDLLKQLLQTVRTPRIANPLRPLEIPNNLSFEESVRRTLQLGNPEIYNPGRELNEFAEPVTIPPAEIPTPAAPDPDCARDCIPLTIPPVLGGGYLDIRTKTTGRRDVHHMPSWQATQASTIGLGRLGNGGRNIAPGICMLRDDHQDTASYGGGPNSRNARFRAQETAQINSGNYDVAQIMGIADVRGQFGSKYDFGIIQMINYTRRLQSQQPLLFQ